MEQASVYNSSSGCRHASFLCGVRIFWSTFCSVLVDGRTVSQIQANAWYEAILLFLSNCAKMLLSDPPKVMEAVSGKLLVTHNGLFWRSKGIWLQEDPSEWLQTIPLRTKWDELLGILWTNPRLYQEWVAESGQLYKCPWTRPLTGHKGNKVEVYCMLLFHTLQFWWEDDNSFLCSFYYVLRPF